MTIPTRKAQSSISLISVGPMGFGAPSVITIRSTTRACGARGRRGRREKLGRGLDAIDDRVTRKPIRRFRRLGGKQPQRQAEGLEPVDLAQDERLGGAGIRLEHVGDARVRHSEPPAGRQSAVRRHAGRTGVQRTRGRQPLLALTELAELKQSAEALLYTSERAVTEFGDIATPELLESVKGDIAALRASIDGGDAIAIREALQKLELSAYTLVSRVSVSPRSRKPTRCTRVVGAKIAETSVWPSRDLSSR